MQCVHNVRLQFKMKKECLNARDLFNLKEKKTVK